MTDTRVNESPKKRYKVMVEVVSTKSHHQIHIEEQLLAIKGMKHNNLKHTTQGWHSNTPKGGPWGAFSKWHRSFHPSIQHAS